MRNGERILAKFHYLRHQRELAQAYSMTTSEDLILDDLPVRFSQELFDDLARTVYTVRLEGKDENMPVIPTVLEFQRALIDGDLDEGLTEFHARMHDVAEVSISKSMGQPLVLKVGSRKFIPLAMTDLIVEIDRDPTRLENVSEMETFIIALGLGQFHSEWEAQLEREPGLKHPLAPLVEEWFKRPTPIQLSDRRAGILPKQMEGCRALGYLTGLPPVESALGPQDHQLALLPPFPSDRKTVIPTVVFSTWIVSGGTMRTRGIGAPLPMRIFFEAITEMPPEARKNGKRWRLEMTLRDLRDRLFPRKRGQRHDFDPKSDIEGVRAALREVDQMRVPVRYGEHDEWADWRPVSVTLLPRPHLNSIIIFDLEVPPGSGGGALIDRLPMRWYGLKSGPKYSASIGLAYYWDKYGTHRYGIRPIQATRPLVWRNDQGQALGSDGTILLNAQGQPLGTTYSDDRLVFLNEAGLATQGASLEDRRRAAARERNPAVELYPLLHDYDLLTLFYPDSTEATGNLRRKRLQRSREALGGMAADGYCVVEDAYGPLDERALRILPTDWSYFSIC